MVNLVGGEIHVFGYPDSGFLTYAYQEPTVALLTMVLGFFKTVKSDTFTCICLFMDFWYINDQTFIGFL